LGKKHKRIESKYVPTKRQTSRWQRQTRIQRIIIIAAAVFLAGIMGYVGYGYYNDRIKPLHQTVIEVNDTAFTMGYYVKMLEAYAKGVESQQVYYLTDIVASQIAQDELVRQGADSLGIKITAQEIDAKIEENKLPNKEVYRDIVAAGLLREALQEYFASQLPGKMEQAHIQVMLVESQEVADDLITKVESGGNFTALVEEFSCYPMIEGDLGWLPQELMPNPLIAEAAFSEIASPSARNDSEELTKIYDESATKNVGYWLIEIVDTDEEKGIKARAMLLGSEQEASEIKTRLSNGEDFAEVAEEHSQHESKDNGGELDWLKLGDMNSEAFDEVAFNLPLAEVSEPVQDKSVQTTAGYWIVKVWENGEHALSEDVREKLKTKHFDEWFQEQWESSTINSYLDEEKKSWAVNRVL